MIKYVHTNIVAKDWRKLVEFYVAVFDCEKVLPERDLSGKWIDDITAIKDVNIQGMHLRLPGYDNGPTLEIFSYNHENLRKEASSVNKQGFGHLAFHVSDVEAVLQSLLAHGGSTVGELVTKYYENIGELTVVYAKDPEGNIVEIQNWKYE